MEMQSSPYPQHTVVVQQAAGRPESYLIFSCVVFWCCNFLFGGIAFIFSMLSKSAADRNDLVEARKMGRVSLWLNIAGIIITIIIVIIVIVIYVVLVASIFGAVGKGIAEGIAQGFGNNGTSS